MNIRAVFHLISYLLMVIAVAIASCAGISFIFHDPVSTIQGLLLAGATTFIAGLAICILTRGKIDLSRRDGFGIVTFGWIMVALFGALPYMFSGVMTNYTSALFETMSGFTTTGASVLTNLESLPKGILFWRGLTQWLGGMGVLVLCVAILPFLGVGGMQLYRAEMPGPSKDRLTPRITSTAKFLWGVYLLLSTVEFLLLWAGKMDWYDAVIHTFTTMSTGGFSTRTASVAAYESFYIEAVIIVFMFLAGVNFSLHFRALRGEVTSYFRDAEFRFYLLTWLGASLFIGLNLWRTQYDSLTHALRAGLFQVTSIMTTTGYATEDFDLWPAASCFLLLGLMFIGASAGSTAGGIKNIRVFVVIKLVLREIKLFLQPQAVLKIKMGKKAVTQTVITNILGFFVIFVSLFLVITFIISLYTHDLMTAASAVAATLGNIGPGLGGVGPTRTYEFFPDSAKLILTFCMLLGRLELFTVLVLLLPRCWKK